MESATGGFGRMGIAGESHKCIFRPRQIETTVYLAVTVRLWRKLIVDKESILEVPGDLLRYCWYIRMSREIKAVL